MEKEKIKELFTQEIETLISEAELAIEEMSRAASLKAKYELLENFDLFVKAINAKMNSILDSNGVDFKSQAELDSFMNFMRPTFDKMYEKYMDLGKDEY